MARRHVWPPYTSPERFETHDPLVIVEAEGAWLVDADGRRYLDGISSWWTCTLGHGHPRLRRALTEQAARLCHVSAGGGVAPVTAQLAEELCAAAPAGLERVHFSDDGSTAVEVACKIAFQYWQQNGHPERRRFLALTSAYHGDTLGAVSLAGRGAFFDVFGPLMFEVGRVEEIDQIRTDDLAAIVVEPLIQGAAGMQMCSEALLQRLRDLDTLLIADEVFTGYGRTGSMWACERAGITPDLLCTAKGFTAGVLPMAATLATARLYDGFRGGPGRALMHGHTFCGHPLGAAVAREVLAIYRDERVLDGIPVRAERIARGMARIAALPGVLRTRHLGMVGAADLGDGGYHGALGPRFYDAARRRGLYLRPLGDTVYTCPPLTIPLDELDLLLDGMHDAIAEVTRG